VAITYQVGSDIAAEQLLDLYSSVEWSTYTEGLKKLEQAVAASLHVVTAWDGDRLVGLARVVGDGLTIVYLQDILVHPDNHRQGIGRELFQRVLEPYQSVRQQVLMTDDEPAQRGFYESLGFTEVWLVRVLAFQPPAPGTPIYLHTSETRFQTLLLVMASVKG
jgi:GNAT superfamily N-acetyltransferase